MQMFHKSSIGSRRFQRFGTISPDYLDYMYICISVLRFVKQKQLINKIKALLYINFIEYTYCMTIYVLFGPTKYRQARHGRSRIHMQA